MVIVNFEYCPTLLKVPSHMVTVECVRMCVCACMSGLALVGVRVYRTVSEQHDCMIV